MKLHLKTHSFPGDSNKQGKARMLEGQVGTPSRRKKSLRDVEQHLRRCAKTFKKVVRLKERAVLKRRARKEIES